MSLLSSRRRLERERAREVGPERGPRGVRGSAAPRQRAQRAPRRAHVRARHAPLLQHITLTDF